MSAAAVQAMAQGAVAVKPVGMTPTSYLMLVGIVFIIPMLGTILGLVIKNIPKLREISANADAGMLDHAIGRIDTLEKALADERRQCEARINSMQSQIDGLTRQLIAFQVSSGRPMGFSPEATAAADRVMQHMERKEGEA